MTRSLSTAAVVQAENFKALKTKCKTAHLSIHATIYKFKGKFFQEISFTLEAPLITNVSGAGIPS
jgi:hypothetical protein